MSQTLYFYDLETSGINARNAKIMQFAGQRTDLDLNPLGKPDNILIKMAEDCLPDPQAILITKITPQDTLNDGICEQQFAEYFTNTVMVPNTTIVGYNTIRFDNEFIRFLLYRNFYDAYEWSYKNGSSTWDILDLVRITRALRPDGIKWPFAPDGSPTNRLELLTSVNKISHLNAHDALSDVNATIAIAKLIKQKQPKIYDYLYNMRSKHEVAKLVQTGQPFLYTSGRYSNDTLKTTVAVMIGEHPVYGSSRALVYDLSQDPSEFIALKPEDLLQRMQYVKDINTDTPKRLPVKELTYNKCPAVAPLGVLKGGKLSDKLDLNIISANLAKLKHDPSFANRVASAFEQNISAKQQTLITDISGVDGQLYDGFFNNYDQKLMADIRGRQANELADYQPNFNDERLEPLLLLYKARNMPQILNQEEQAKWQKYRHNKLLRGGESSELAKYFKQLQNLMQSNTDESAKNLLQDLWLWGESIAPSDN